jgi:hypothetical protein
MRKRLRLIQAASANNGGDGMRKTPKRRRQEQTSGGERTQRNASPLIIAVEPRRLVLEAFTPPPMWLRSANPKAIVVSIVE